MEEWIAENFCKLRMCQNGRCDFRIYCLPSDQLIASFISDEFHFRMIWTEPVSDDYVWFSVLFYDFLHDSQSSFMVTSLWNKSFEHFDLMNNGALEIMCLAIDLHKDLVEVPAQSWLIRGSMYPFLAKFTSKHWAKPVPSITYSFATYIDATFMV